MVERRGTAAQIERALQETSAWLTAHVGDINVREAYLGLVERKGTTKQIERALRAEGGQMSRAAARLGLERSHLYKKMRQLGMRDPG